MTALTASILVILSVLVSGGIVFAVPVQRPFLKLLLAFSGAYLLSVCFADILPGLYGSGIEPAYIGLFILLGFLLQIILEYYSQGIEHGHVHLHHHEKNPSRVLVSLSVSLYIHSFLEGMPLAQIDSITNPLLWGIILHNIPVSIAYTSMLRTLAFRTKTAMICLVLFSLATPLGMLFGSFITSAWDAGSYNAIALSVAVGIFLHISTTIIFETGENHKYNFRKLLAIVIGMLLGLLPHFAGHHHH